MWSNMGDQSESFESISIAKQVNFLFNQIKKAKYE